MWIKSKIANLFLDPHPTAVKNILELILYSFIFNSHNIIRGILCKSLLISSLNTYLYLSSRIVSLYSGLILRTAPRNKICSWLSTICSGVQKKKEIRRNLNTLRKMIIAHPLLVVLKTHFQSLEFWYMTNKRGCHLLFWKWGCHLIFLYVG